MKKNEYLWGITWKGTNSTSGKSIWAENFEQAYMLAKAESEPDRVLVKIELAEHHTGIYLHNYGL